MIKIYFPVTLVGVSIKVNDQWAAKIHKARLDLSYKGLHSKHGRQLASFIEATQLTALNLLGNDLNSKALKVILRAIFKSNTIECLSVGFYFSAQKREITRLL